MRFESRQAAFNVEELFKTDICGEAGFGYVIIKQFQCQTVTDD
jgi:hypothetical protein